MNRYIKHFPDKWYTVVATNDAPLIKCKIYKIESQPLGANPEDFGYGYKHLPLEQANACASGSVKWDGCSDWDIEHSHFCSREMIEHFSQILLWCWDYASKNLEGFDG